MFLLGVFVVANVGCTSTLGRQSTVSGTSADERASVTRKLELDTTRKFELDTTHKSELDTTHKFELDTTRKLELDDVVFMYMPSDFTALAPNGAAQSAFARGT